MSRTDVCRNGRMHVQSEMCDTCIFRPGNLMHLEPGHVSGMVREATDNGGCIPCHKTITGKNQSVCRGFYDLQSTPEIKILTALGLVQFTEPKND